jgi:hypothetical protein
MDMQEIFLYLYGRSLRFRRASKRYSLLFMKNRFFKLPFSFHLPELLHDLDICLRGEWPKHHNTNDYAGSWTSLALRSPSGNIYDTYAHAPNDVFMNTGLMEKCSYFRMIVDSFECKKETVRLLRLAPGSRIKQHTDRGEAYEYGAFRVHIPITTEEEVFFTIDNERVHMAAAECWYASFHLPHSVEHNGTRDRVHLILDCCRNEWSDKLFAQAGYDFEEERRLLEPDDRTKRMMIESLSYLDTDTARDMIHKLKKELGDY